MENTEVVISDKMASPAPLTYEDIRQNSKLIAGLVKELLRDNIDYGKIPGCGDKPALLKPGAEKINMLFKLRAVPEILQHDDADRVRYVIRTKLIHIPTDREVGFGLGSASSDEDKYKWRAAVHQKEFDATPEERRRQKWVKGKYDAAKKAYGDPYTINQIRTNPADIENTILKMAAKRSLVDAVIKTCAASDFLIPGEDEAAGQVEHPEGQEPPARPQERPAAAAAEEILGAKPAGKPIPESLGLKLMTSKYDNGTCKTCNGQIPKGAEIYYSKDRGAHHVKCVTT